MQTWFVEWQCCIEIRYNRDAQTGDKFVIHVLKPSLPQRHINQHTDLQYTKPKIIFYSTLDLAESGVDSQLHRICFEMTATKLAVQLVAGT